MRGDRRRSESGFRDEMAEAGATAISTWANGPGYVYAPHAHGYKKVLCCLEGSIVFHLPDADVALTAGERTVVEPGTRHAATVGPAGVRCAEAHFG